MIIFFHVYKTIKNYLSKKKGKKRRQVHAFFTIKTEQ